MNLSKNVTFYTFGEGSLKQLESRIKERQEVNPGIVCLYVDHFFKDSDLISRFNKDDNILHYIDSTHEPSTDGVDEILKQTIEKLNGQKPSCVVGIGGGSTLDTAKAISNLFENKGRAEDYQGWDLVKKPGVYKIGVPTISGTGAEASRTCVMMNVKKNLKLGMNSEYTIYDELILDPELTKTVPRDQFFYTGMDTYIHCVESLEGTFRHPVGDSFSHQALNECRDVFLGQEDMMSDKNRAKMMVASYLGGAAIANSYVGVIHPISAGLSVVLDIHHCLANCIAFNQLREFYPKQHDEFQKFLDINKINLPSGICSNLSDEQLDRLYESSIIHEKPLINALGEKFKDVLTKEKVREIFSRM